VTTTYSVSSAGCSSALTGSVIVTVNPQPDVSATATNNVVCAGLSTTLTASGASTYTWSPATGLSSTTGTSVTATPLTTPNYSVTGTDANGCTDISTVMINVTSSLQPEITNDGPLTYCEGTIFSVTLDAGSGYADYEWNDDSDGQTLTATGPGTYSVTVFDNDGCLGTDDITIQTLALPIVEIINDTSIIQGESIELFASGGASYSWSPTTGLNDPFSSEPIANPTETITYVVNVVGSNGCESRDTVVIMVEILNECQIGKLFIPTAFSPNGDGLNDEFKVQISGGYDKFYLAVRNRWGQTVFESTDINDGWDGQMEGKSLSSDALGYFLEITCGDRVITRQGSVTVIR